MSAFLGESVHLDEEETLDNGYIENALTFMAFKAEDAGMFKGKDGAAQKFVDSVGTDAYRDVQHVKALLAQLESKIKENYKPSDEIQEWRSQLALASSAVEVYRHGWQVCVCVPQCVCVYRSVCGGGRPWPKSTLLCFYTVGIRGCFFFFIVGRTHRLASCIEERKKGKAPRKRCGGGEGEGGRGREGRA
jgi:hypothetical protein